MSTTDKASPPRISWERLMVMEHEAQQRQRLGKRLIAELMDLLADDLAVEQLAERC